MFLGLDTNEEYKVNTYPKEHWTPLLELIPSLEEMQRKRWYDDETTFTNMAIKLESLVYKLQIVMADYTLKEDGFVRFDCFDADFDLNKLSLVDLCKMFTGIIRGDRFCENLIVSRIADGTLFKLVQAISLKVN